MSALLCGVFFLSGAAALLFETLWFREAGLLLGNSVWATSLVTSSFMAGLALGNTLAARHGERLRRPVLAYAGLEALIGASGFGLVLLLPLLVPILAPLFTPLLARPGTLAGLRLAVAFALLTLPATAMGATLPLLARALSARDPHFGRVLGLLYGWNTLGAVFGALLGEGYLLERLGVRGVGQVAASLNLFAALSALALAKADAVAPVVERVARSPFRGTGVRLLSAASLAGAILLALEVVWFRLLLLFVFGTSLSFAVMLAIVLLGIGLGGLAASLWLKSESAPGAWLATIALGAGTLSAWGYAAWPDTLRALGERYFVTPEDIACAAAPLMLPTAFVSGVLFTALGTALQKAGHGESRATGLLTLANTIGAMLGALLGGFLLLPQLGVERAIFWLSAAYAGVALLVLPGHGEARTRGCRLALVLTAATFAVVHALFPFGLMNNHFLVRSNRLWQADGSRLVAQREGLTETISYLTKELWGEPVYHRLVTNGFSMSGSAFPSLRYMRLFVHFPVAVHPHPRRALLISYGVGITAKALADTKELEAIDVVDVSRDILDLGRLVFPRPGTSPLDDPRVSVHVEDGRFFLLTAPGSYDLITAEPPPPKNAGIANLYSREFFALVRQRLAPGGITTYWLPAHQLEVSETKAIIRGFCEAFDDCSLWTGIAAEWMLVGTRNAPGPVDEARFTAQWRDPDVGATLRGIGFETPELLGTTFLADGQALRAIVGDAPPLDDDHPLRVSARFVSPQSYVGPLDTDVTRQRFADSAVVRRLWPAALRERTLAAFVQQRMLNRAFGLGAPYPVLPALDEVLTGSRLRTPVLLGLGASAVEIGIARRAAQRGVSDPLLDRLLGIDALADRDYGHAAALFAQAERGEHAGQLRRLRVLALGLGGRAPEARSLLASAPRAGTPSERQEWAWLEQRFR